MQSLLWSIVKRSCAGNGNHKLKIFTYEAFRLCTKYDVCLLENWLGRKVDWFRIKTSLNSFCCAAIWFSGWVKNVRLNLNILYKEVFPLRGDLNNKINNWRVIKRVWIFKFLFRTTFKIKIAFKLGRKGWWNVSFLLFFTLEILHIVY